MPSAAAARRFSEISRIASSASVSLRGFAHVEQYDSMAFTRASIPLLAVRPGGIERVIKGSI